MMRTAGAFLIAGSVLFLVGAGLGVPRVFMTSDPRARRELLERRRTSWRVAQPLYAGGAVLAAVGVGLLAASGTGGEARGLFLGAAAMLIGAGAWSYSCYLRGARPTAFALGELPGWPFAVYVMTTIAGLALLGGGLARVGYSGWLAWSVIGADLLFLAIYAATRDIPPFVFYLLLLAVGVVLLVDPRA